MKAALYLRISSDRSGEELGVSRQREDCEKLAALRGWEVVTTYVENDVSASGHAKRPKFELLLSGVQNGSYDVVVAWNLDRLTRNRPDTVRLIEIGQASKLTIALARGSDLDMSTPMGRMMADQLAGWARYEIEQKSDRQKRANSQRAESGLPHAGRRAFGYDRDGVTIVEDEALILKDIAHRYLNGWSFNEIAWFLNERGYRTTMGNPFVGVAVRQLLQRERYAGRRTYDGVTYQGTWTPIFDADTWTRLQYTIRERSRVVEGKPAARRYLLTGLLTCGACGHPMNGGRQRAYKTDIIRVHYRCKRQGAYERVAGCGRVSRGAIPLEDFIKELIIYRLDTTSLAELLSVQESEKATLAELLNERAALSARLDELVDDYSDGILDRGQFKRARSRVDASLEDVGARLEAANNTQAASGLLNAGESVRQRWEAETLGWRRQMVELLIENITVNASQKKPRYQVDGKTYYFDAEAIDVAWRV